MSVETIDRLSRRHVTVPIRHVISALVGGLLLVSLLAFAARDLAAPSAATPREDSFVKIRTKTIQSQLDQVEGDYLIALGDSHAERLYLPQICGLDVLNAGISGATAHQVLDLVEALKPRLKARRLILIVGTNDIWIRRHPDSPGAVEAFGATLRQLLGRLNDWTDRITLIAIPPVASRQEAQFPRSAAERFTAAMHDICEGGRCDVVSVFDRAGEQPGRSRSGLDRDGVHLSNYARYIRAAEPRLCGGPALTADAGGEQAKPSLR